MSCWKSIVQINSKIGYVCLEVDTHTFFRLQYLIKEDNKSGGKRILKKVYKTS